MEERRELCVTCLRSILRARVRHELTEEYMEARPGFSAFVLDHINLQQAALNEVQYMCHRCWVAANRQEERLQQVQQPDNEPGDEENSQVISIPTYKRLANTSRHCAFHGCGNEDLHRVPLFLKIHSLVEHNIYVPPSARLCTIHMTSNEWELLNDFTQTSFSPEQTKDMLDTLRDAYRTKSVLDFDNVTSISSEELYFRTGLTHEQFATLLNETPSLAEQSKRPKTVLGAYLIKLRSAEPDVRIACHLNISRRTLGRYFKIARECLTSEFVPRHLGLDHINREDIIRHNLVIPTALFGSTIEPKAILIVDGTYIYIQKSMNFAFQKKTYSLHKYKNLLKPFLLVCTDGYIIDITGPHAATTSDATIMTELMNENHAPIHYLLHEGDAFILDRGFRDAIPDLDCHGYESHMPPSKNRGSTQLTNEQANESRKITIVRWIIEVINGWFKRDFKLFRNQHFNKSLPHLFTDFRIAGALLNSFRERLRDVRHAATITEIINERMNVPNRLGNYVTGENVNRQRAAFVSMNDESINIPFPVLTEDEIILICLGTYHLRLARSYVSEHLRGGVYNMEVCLTASPRMTRYGIRTENCMLLRVRISSRHISNKIYYTYLLINPNLEGRSAIIEYYCSCLTGMRTVGACAHTVSIIWYFGICRHLDSFVGPASAWDNIIVQSRNTI